MFWEVFLTCLIIEGNANISSNPKITITPNISTNVNPFFLSNIVHLPL